jgi:mannitol-1-phosphate/altronate dehydrogenase
MTTTEKVEVITAAMERMIPRFQPIVEEEARRWLNSFAHEVVERYISRVMMGDAIRRIAAEEREKIEARIRALLDAGDV